MPTTFLCKSEEELELQISFPTKNSMEQEFKAQNVYKQCEAGNIVF